MSESTDILQKPSVHKVQIEIIGNGYTGEFNKSKKEDNSKKDEKYEELKEAAGCGGSPQSNESEDGNYQESLDFGNFDPITRTFLHYADLPKLLKILLIPIILPFYIASIPAYYYTCIAATFSAVFAFVVDYILIIVLKVPFIHISPDELFLRFKGLAVILACMWALGLFNLIYSLTGVTYIKVHRDKP